MKKRGYRKPRTMAEINIVPFTDVILVLLIIFMVATPLISRNKIDVKLPQSGSKESVDNASQVYITVTSEGMTYLDKELVTIKELKQKIVKLNKNSNLKVVIAADQSCRFQDVVKVMDILKDSGVQNLNIATRTGK